MCVESDVDYGVVLGRKRLCSRPELESEHFRVMVSVAPQIEWTVESAVRVESGPPAAENAADERYDNCEVANEERRANLNI